MTVNGHCLSIGDSTDSGVVVVPGRSLCISKLARHSKLIRQFDKCQLMKGGKL
jgi:hypothetical protein